MLVPVTEDYMVDTQLVPNIPDIFCKFVSRKRSC